MCNREHNESKLSTRASTNLPNKQLICNKKLPVSAKFSQISTFAQKCQPITELETSVSHPPVTCVPRWPIKQFLLQQHSRAPFKSILFFIIRRQALGVVGGKSAPCVFSASCLIVASVCLAGRTSGQKNSSKQCLNSK